TKAARADSAPTMTRIARERPAGAATTKVASSRRDSGGEELARGASSGWVATIVAPPNVASSRDARSVKSPRRSADQVQRASISPSRAMTPRHCEVILRHDSLDKTSTQ